MFVKKCWPISSKLSGTRTKLPTANSGCAVFNGRYLAADAALYRFDPITGIATIVTLTNWYPSLVDAACVHVPELNVRPLEGMERVTPLHQPLFRTKLCSIEL